MEVEFFLNVRKSMTQQTANCTKCFYFEMSSSCAQIINL